MNREDKVIIMLIDILIIAIIILFAIYGYKKGFIIQIINLIAGVLYMMFSSQLLISTLGFLNQDELINTLEHNSTSQIIVIALVGIVLFAILNLIMKKLFKLKILSFINHLGGLVIGLVFVYLLICFVNIILMYLGVFINYDEYLQQSFFLSSDFKQYNIIEWWLMNE